MPDPEMTTSASAFSDQDVSDAYIYLLSRLLVLRQQHLDLQEGFRWNELVHRQPGEVVWPNPNLDVAYSEAWVAIDEDSPLLVTVPKIEGRYYTVQFLNGWGEVMANINERTAPDRPDGLFAVCLKGSSPDIPAGAARVDVPVRWLRVLLRVELGPNWDDAIALQHQFKFASSGKPKLPDLPKPLKFDTATLPGVEAFEAAKVAIDSEADLNPGMEAVQAKALAIGEAVKDPAVRARVDQVIRTKALADLAAASPKIGHGTTRNYWTRPGCCGAFGADWLTRTLVNLGGIWANTFDEVIYYRSSQDGTGAPLSSKNVYTLTFPADDLPAKYARYFWSVIAVDNEHYRVLPNPMKRYLLNKESDLAYGEDGSLTLYFAAEKPADAPEGNWLPTPTDYRFTFRFYGPRGGVTDGTYYPPPVTRR